MAWRSMGANLGSLKGCIFQTFTGTVSCIHSSEGERGDGWCRPTHYMSVRPDEILDRLEETVSMKDATIIE